MLNDVNFAKLEEDGLLQQKPMKRGGRGTVTDKPREVSTHASVRQKSSRSRSASADDGEYVVYHHMSPPVPAVKHRHDPEHQSRRTTRPSGTLCLPVLLFYSMSCFLPVAKLPANVKLCFFAHFLQGFDLYRDAPFSLSSLTVSGVPGLAGAECLHSRF